MACYLEYEPTRVKVHELIWARQPDGWPTLSSGTSKTPRSWSSVMKRRPEW
jgi:hypothetical protein